MTPAERASVRALLRGIAEMAASAHAILEQAEMPPQERPQEPKEPADSPLKRRLSYMGANDEPQEG